MPKSPITTQPALQVRAHDTRSGRSVVDYFVVKKLADLMVRLVATAERVTDTEIQQISALTGRVVGRDQFGPRNRRKIHARSSTQDPAVQRAENEGMPPPSATASRTKHTSIPPLAPPLDQQGKGNVKHPDAS